MTEPRPAAAPPSFSLIQSDALFRLQQAAGLIPARGGLGIGRRAVTLALVTWAPVAGWALLVDRAVGHGIAEPLMGHFGVHVRCLLAIPLLVAADATTQRMTSQLLPYFVTSGLVGDHDRARYEGILRDVGRLRDRWLPWVVLLGLVLAWTLLRPVAADIHELRWATDGGGTVLRPGFGGWWFLHVSRPVFAALLLGWIWRIALLWTLFRRIAGLDLSLVPTHPDHVGGLGFLDYVPVAFAPVVLAASTVAASRWAHDVVYHDVPLADLRLPAAALIVVTSTLVLAPLFAFRRPLARIKHRALLAYGALIGEHGRRVHRRWILGEPVEDDAILTAPELGPVADTTAIYDVVRSIRPIPVGITALAIVVIPAILPIIVVAGLRVPAKDLLLGLVKVLL